ncbi:MAG: tetratricopeptide repeat protein [Treponema sp.]|nr:tetratricopeptide repeat protein [Treponema sp.]
MADNSFLLEGINYYKQKLYSKALTFFLSLPSDLESTELNKIEIAYYLGLCFAQLKKYDDALLYLEQVVTSGTQLERVSQCRFLLAVIYAITGRKRLADFELNKLLETGYMSSSVQSALAFVAWEQKDIRKCMDYYEEALRVDSTNLTAMNGLGYVLACQDKDLSRALSLCKEAVRTAPESAACLDSLGWVYYKLGLYEDARKYLQKAENLDENNQIIAEHVRLLDKAVS